MSKDHEHERPTNASNQHVSANSSPLQDSKNAVHRVKRRPNRWTLLGLAVAAVGLVGVFLSNSLYDSPPADLAPATTAGSISGANPCSQASSLQSQEAQVATRIEIINQSSKVILIYWIDYDGAYQFYGNLGPGQSKLFNTFLTHPWLITDPAGTCLSIFFPSQEHTQAVVGTSDSAEAPAGDVTAAPLRTEERSADPLQTASFVVTALGLAVAVLSWLAPAPFRKAT
jgi:hypothetical protein